MKSATISPEKPIARNFRPISVGQCHAQTGKDRFGHQGERAIRDRERIAMGQEMQGNEMPFVWPGPDDSSDDDHKDDDVDYDQHHHHDHTTEKSIYRVVPSMQTSRNNLTALSQSYNLYFVAYQGRIFVYRPRSGTKHTLPRHPDLQLKPRPTETALRVGGYLNSGTGHVINHITTGFLGHEEIVLACYDHGDVLAYYTKDIAHYVFNKPKPWPASGSASEPTSDFLSPVTETSSRPHPKQFFQDNVGSSAWGLAIHQPSRLIAVTSNKHEVTVFAFAVYPIPPGPNAEPEKEHCDDVEAWVRQRRRNWRIIVLLGPRANNLPNVCFLDDQKGCAEKICAVDIKGVTWIANIWKPGQPATEIPMFDPRDCMSEEFYPDASRGWGVLAFRPNAFMMVHSVEELLGSPAYQCDIKEPPHPPSALHQPLVRIEKCLERIPDNPCASHATPQHPSRRHEIHEFHELLFAAAGPAFQEDFDDFEDNLEDDSDDDSDDSEPIHTQGFFDPDGQPHDVSLQPVPAQNTNEPIFPSTSGPIGFNVPWPWQAAFENLGEAVDELEEALGQIQHAFPTPTNHLPAPDDVISVPTHAVTGCPFSGNLIPTIPNHEPGRRPQIGDGRLDMVYYPHSGRVQKAPMNKKAKISLALTGISHNHNPNNSSEALERLAPGYRILRTYEKDFDMWKIPEGGRETSPNIGILCSNVLKFRQFRDLRVLPWFRTTSRINMLCHVPELSLVALGSPTGRVLLATLTRMVSPTAHSTRAWIWDYGIRVEWILPKVGEEKAHRKSLRPLYGMALGRILDDGDKNGEQAGRGASLPRRYRLMLHYLNHDILSYEITRDEQTGKLCIF